MDQYSSFPENGDDDSSWSGDPDQQSSYPTGDTSYGYQPTYAIPDLQDPEQWTQNLQHHATDFSSDAELGIEPSMATYGGVTEPQPMAGLRQVTNLLQEQTNLFQQNTNGFQPHTNESEQHTNGLHQHTNGSQQHTNGLHQHTNGSQRHANGLEQQMSGPMNNFSFYTPPTGQSSAMTSRILAASPLEQQHYFSPMAPAASFVPHGYVSGPSQAMLGNFMAPHSMMEFQQRMPAPVLDAQPQPACRPCLPRTYSLSIRQQPKWAKSNARRLNAFGDLYRSTDAHKELSTDKALRANCYVEPCPIVQIHCEDLKDPKRFYGASEYQQLSFTNHPFLTVVAELVAKDENGDWITKGDGAGGLSQSSVSPAKLKEEGTVAVAAFPYLEVNPEGTHALRFSLFEEQRYGLGDADTMVVRLAECYSETFQVLKPNASFSAPIGNAIAHELHELQHINCRLKKTTVKKPTKTESFSVPVAQKAQATRKAVDYAGPSGQPHEGYGAAEYRGPHLAGQCMGRCGGYCAGNCGNCGGNCGGNCLGHCGRFYGGPHL